MEPFSREYTGDNENRQWVRKMMEAKGIKVDRRKVMMILPMTSINILFFNTVKREFPDYYV
jgi:hypothetical protein